MKKTKKKPNKLDKLVLKITQPIKMDSEIEFERLGVFVGPNGVGKTLILKIAYALGAIGGTAQMLPIEVPTMESAQFVFDNTFTDQNFDGTLEAIYTEGSIKVELKDGKVTNVHTRDQKSIVPIVFMSSEMRTFSQMTLYLRMRKQAEKEGDMAGFIKVMMEAYRLYDFTYMESLIRRCPIHIPEHLSDTLKAYDFQDDITSIEVDLEKCEFLVVLKDGSKKNIANYGNGHQAILNMMLGVGV